MILLRELFTSIRPFSSRRTSTGRLADVHMWTIRDCRGTSRVQAFRDENGRTFAVVTRRVGDIGPGHINGAEMFRRAAWTQFFPDDSAPPILIANVLDPLFKFEADPQIVTLAFGDDGIFSYHHATDPADIQTLNLLGAEWDEGAGFVPYTPPPPKYAYVWRRFPVIDLPERHLFRPMEPYLTTDWGKAVEAAIQAIQRGDLDDLDAGDLPPNVVAAARTLLYEPIELGRSSDGVWYVNGQHRTEAMLRQGVEETVLQDTRLIIEPPLSGEIGQAGVS